MTTAKLTGDKLKAEHIKHIYSAFLNLNANFNQLLDNNTADKDFKTKIRRQLNSVEAIIRKEWLKSIERQ